MTLLLAAAVLTLWSSTSAHACSCSWAGPFLNVAPGTPLIVRARVVGHTFRSRDVDLAMDVEVLEVFKGSAKGKRIRIWGDNGAQCRPYVVAFPVQTEWVFAIAELSADGPGKGDYFISVCGEFWARVEGGSVTGRLLSPKPPGVNDTLEKMSLRELAERLKARIRYGVSAPKVRRQSTPHAERCSRAMRCSLHASLRRSARQHAEGEMA